MSVSDQTGLAGSATLARGTFVYVDDCCSGVSAREAGATLSPRDESVLGSVTVLGCSVGWRGGAGGGNVGDWRMSA